MESGGISADLFLVDGHVHVHGCFEVAAFLEAAHENFARVAGQRYPGRSWVGVLCLTEGAGERGFDRLRRARESPRASAAPATASWHARPTEEEVSLRLTSKTGQTLIAIAGCQVQAREGLEVLALGTRRRFDGGAPIEEAIERVAEAGALPVVPWGFGKWIGERGRRVKRLLRDDEMPRFFLGDNANRPSFLPRPTLFARAEAQGVFDLPGSDPLPFPREGGQVGRAGFALEGALSPDAPARDLKATLEGRRRPLPTFMRPEAPLRFARNQLAMQVRKFTRRS